MTSENFWQGKNVRLRAIEPEDAPIFYEWNLDTRTAQLVDFIRPPQSMTAVKEWAQKQAINRSKNDDVDLVIENAGGALVGLIDTHNIDRRVGAFRYGVAVRPEYRRRGYAAEAIQILIRYMFDELGYQKVNATVYSNNEPSIRLHERLGFVLEGTIRRTVRTGGRLYDELYFGMTAEEFRQLNPNRCMTSIKTDSHSVLAEDDPHD